MLKRGENIKKSCKKNCCHIFNARGQVTLFIIIGLLVATIIGIGIYTVMRGQNNISPIKPPVSENIAPIQIFVENCMLEASKEAIIKLGAHAGYIDPFNPYLSRVEFKIDEINKHNSDGVLVSSNNLVPYWYYASQSGRCFNCVESSNAPFLEEMELQISAYTASKTIECVGEFAEFSSKGYSITPLDTLYVSTKILDDNVELRGYYPLEITYSGEKTLLEDYSATANIPLKKYYDLALNITLSEHEHNFLEKITLHLINSYSGLDETKLPPTFGRTSDYELYFWTQSDTTSKLDAILFSTIPIVQLNNSMNYKFIDSQLLSLYEKNFYNFLTLPNTKNYNSVEVKFIYPGGVYIEVSPSNGEIIGPFTKTSTGTALTPVSKTNSYDFFYDVSYPVLVELREEYAPNQYYSFIFALETNLKENMAVKDYFNDSKNRIYWDPNFLSTELTPSKGNYDSNNLVKTFGFKQNTITEFGLTGEVNYKELVGLNSKEKLFCSENQLVSKVSLKTYDSYTEKALLDVNVLYGCGTYASCSIGMTRYDTLRRISSATLNAPSCQNGFLELSKPGYQTKRIPVTTVANNTYDAGSIYLEKLVSKNITLEKYSYAYISESVLKRSSETSTLLENDTVLLTLKKIKETDIDYSFEKIVVFKNSSSQTLELIPGRYIISATLLNTNPWYIAKECAQTCYDDTPLNPFDSDTCEKYPKNNIDVTGMPKGGYTLTESNPLVISLADIEGNDELYIPIVQLPNPRCIDDLDRALVIEDLSKELESGFR